jgi:WD40 repeat protein
VRNSWFHLIRLPFLLLAVLLLLGGAAREIARAEGVIEQVCPANAIQNRTPQFSPQGIILTAFDNTSIWVYNIARDSRYPLPETNPCGTNCHLSADANWITYVDATTQAYYKMRLDGTQRTRLVDYAADVTWWSADTLLIWTPTKEAYLRAENGDGTRTYLNVDGVVNVQPGGRWGLSIEPAGDGFQRAVINLETRDLANIGGDYIPLGMDTDYYDAAAWSPDGEWLAYVQGSVSDPTSGATGAELFAIAPGANTTPVQWTRLGESYGAVRINGRSSGELSWSPDGRKLAFWVIELIGPAPDANTGVATLHLLDVESGGVRAYCGYSTNNHTPNPPRLIWSPDATHIAFGGDVANDGRSVLLMALNTETGIFHVLSEGIFPTLGGTNPIAWGNAP